MDKLLKVRKLDPPRWFKSVRKIIEEMTERTTPVLTPELSLRLVTPNCRLWTSRWEESPFPEPYWAFYWPGGEALTRYLLDNPEVVAGKHVLDLGSGCGSVAIAASLAHTPASVTANDIDPVATVALQLNADLNKVKPESIQISTENLLKSGQDRFEEDSCILLGDMFYNEEFSHVLMAWLLRAVDRGANVFIGDPGRCLNVLDTYKKYLRLIVYYDISDEYRNLFELNSSRLYIWKLSK